MASLVPSLITPSDPDATQWQDANQQRLAAIELQREKLRDLERRARLREIETTTSRLESRRERAEDLELRAQRHKHHVLLRARESSSRKRIEQRRVSERLELARREKTSVDDRRKETSLDGDATVARNWEVWRSEQKPRRLHLQKQKIVRDRTGMGAGMRGEGAHQRPANRPRLSQIGSSIHVIMTPFHYQPSYPAKLKSLLWCLTKAPASSHVLNDILQAESFPTLITIFQLGERNNCHPSTERSILEMDGLSGAASVIAVIDMSAKIFQLCQTYVSAVKEARKDIQRLRDGVTALQDVMTDVRDLAEDSSSSRRSIFSRLN
ncbi:hypothetical protein BKA61DRAFT_567690 [Leptodontidium sp. MPI-SDFR-AT-0119]|nr:hypothetical protein BKA61DRAFT_567690 [Leptodontidium sp. MPI-SDFR-AT-0119]